MFDTVVDAVAFHAKHTGEKNAVIIDDAAITYEELWRKIQQYAATLSKRGVQMGDKIILAANYTEQFIEIYFAVHWIGAVNVVVDKNASVGSISKLIQAFSPKLILLNHIEPGAESYKSFFTAEWTVSKGSFSTNFLADILYTTGTTGVPKGVMLSHKNEVAGAHNVITGGDMSQQDINLLTMPLHHAFGLTTLRAVLYHGATAVLQDGVASLKKMNENLKLHYCNVIYMVPAALRVLYFQTRQRLDLLLSNVEKLELCTAPVDKKMRQVLSEQLNDMRIYNSYGATESARSVYMRLDKNIEKINAIGQAVSGVSIWIVDGARKEIESSKENVGYLAIRGDMNMLGYYDDSDTTQCVVSDGVFYSEDMGYMDKDGFIYLIGRSNDVINTGGEKVSPLEIENTALEYEGVKECACIGVEDPEGILGQVPILFVVSDSGKKFSCFALQKYIADNLESFKVPCKIIEIEEIPRNHIGKVDRKGLHVLWQENRK